ncbi:MAG: dephospho-CoA kinase [Bacteroidales bacterium]
MMKIGLSGNIGSGKSTVAKLFELLSIPVFYADQEAKNAYYVEEIKKDVIKLFGKNSYSKDHTIDKKHLAECIFNDPLAVKKINAIIHPYVFKQWNLFCKKHHRAPYCIMEAAILHESGSHTLFDEVILVTAPKELRIRRVMNRENCTYDEVNARIKMQWTENEKRKYSTIFINNSQKNALIPQVIETHKLLSERK